MSTIRTTSYTSQRIIANEPRSGRLILYRISAGANTNRTRATTAQAVGPIDVNGRASVVSPQASDESVVMGPRVPEEEPCQDNHSHGQPEQNRVHLAREELGVQGEQQEGKDRHAGPRDTRHHVRVALGGLDPDFQGRPAVRPGPNRESRRVPSVAMREALPVS